MTNLPGDPCPVCRRASCGINLEIPGRGFVRLCSVQCAEIWMNRRPQSQNEREALEHGGQEAGRYLDGIGKTDLSRLSAAEWSEFCGILFNATCDHLRKQAEDWIPF